jgi:acetyl-CoA carboxylase biotin carboxylase subunit
MRTAASDEELVRAFPLAQAEALAAFGNGDLYVERLVLRARHVEVQIAADNFGNVIHLGERDCSLQRRHQKILEEAPSPALDEGTRRGLCEAAVEGARSARYRSVGTMEFLFDPEGAFYFIEMNTRLQVEHPVTEMVTGIDVAKLQIRIAEGEKLPYTQAEIKTTGHAIECRIVAEDPDRDFAPDFAVVDAYRSPGGPGVRVDTHIYAGYEPPPFYDSLLGKVIVWGQDRAEAIGRMDRALNEIVVHGPKTSVPYQLAVLRDEEFRAGRAHTQWGLRHASDPGV